MSVMNAGGYGRQDAATFAQQFPRPGGGMSTVQAAGVPVPSDLAPLPAGNPSFPWAGLVIALILLRVATHLRKE